MSSNSPFDTILAAMWTDYLKLNPGALAIYNLLESQGEKILNDHIALRTFNHPDWGIESLAWIFLKYGYREKNTYEFKEKKLFAKHYEPPKAHPHWPKIFISELLLEQTSEFMQTTLKECINATKPATLQSEDLIYVGRPWGAKISTYQKLALESEYGSWVYAHGFRPNHFTVNVNALTKFKSLAELNSFLKKQGHSLNASGGEIKGSAEVLLEQSSTMALDIPVQFADGTLNIPGCYYEFAKRYPMKNGELYTGFVAASADKIFESTNAVKAL